MGLWERAVSRPVDTIAVLAAGAASLIIIVNAVFLQSGPRQGPFIANPASQPPGVAGPTSAATAPIAAASKPADRISAHQLGRPPTAQPTSARHNDPIGDLIGASIGPSSRVMAVQRVLSAFGYGQIKPSGFLDQPTSAAIEKFESDHKLPVTGQPSDRLVNALAAMAGHPIE
jgi:hypothetical protein